MSAGVKSLLKQWLKEGMYISLHANSPNSSGQPFILQPTLLPKSTMQVRQDSLVNVRQMSVGHAENGGSARYVGIWIDKRTLLISAKLKNPIEVSPGAEVIIPRNGLRIRVTNG